MNRLGTGMLALIMVWALAPGLRTRPASQSTQNAELLGPAPDRHEPIKPELQASPSDVSLDLRLHGTFAGPKACEIAANSFKSRLLNTIRTSYSVGPKPVGQFCAENFQLTSEQQSSTHVIFAIVPDPAHTNLSLFFDRQMDALQEGMQDTTWTFERALLPWDNRRNGKEIDLQPGGDQTSPGADDQNEPGLLIFRQKSQHLLVFVVGETPTAGIEKAQFREAYNLITTSILPNKKPDRLFIFGPTFSGSLRSLSELLDCRHQQECELQPYIFSGTISSKSTMDQFRTSTPSASFCSLEENDEYAIEQFTDFEQHRSYSRDEIAILSEDETSYGAYPASHLHADAKHESEPPKLYFPREISQLRSAYQRTVSQGQVADGQLPRAILPLNLESGNGDRDSVPQFSKQIAASQEAVLLGIVGELRKHHSHFVLLRATDPLDQLFLARYLRTAYPDARIVVVSSDLLFARELTDSRLHGIMALTTYPLTPGADHDFDEAIRVFPSANSVGSYNAVKMLMAARHTPKAKLRKADSSGCPEVIPVHLSQYAWPLKAATPGAATPGAATPGPLHLSVLGNDGFWDVAVLPTGDGVGLFGWIRDRFRRNKGEDEESGWKQENQSDTVKSTLPNVTDAPPPGFKSAPRQRTPPAWNFLWFSAIALALAYVYSIWSASCFSSSHAIAQLAPRRKGSRAFLFMAVAYMHVAVLITVLWPYQYSREYSSGAKLVPVVLLTVLLLVAGVGLLDLDGRGGPRYRIALFSAFLVTLTPGLLAWRYDYKHFMSVYRSVHIASGVSDLLSIFLFLAAGLWCAWHSLSSCVLQDGRGIRLPQRTSLKKEQQDLRRYRSIMEEDNAKLLKLLNPDRWDLPSLSISSIAVLLALCYTHFRPLRSFEPMSHEYLIAAMASCSALVLLYCTLHLQRTWLELRRLLISLDSTPLRRGFQRLHGFAWSPLWRLGSGTFGDFRRLVTRQNEALHCVKKDLSRAFPVAEDDIRQKYEAAIDGYLHRWDWNRAMDNARAALQRKSRFAKIAPANAAGQGQFSSGAAAAPARAPEPEQMKAAFSFVRVRIIFKAFLKLVQGLNAQQDREVEVLESFERMQNLFASAAMDALAYAAAYWQTETSLPDANQEKRRSEQSKEETKSEAQPLPLLIAACEQYLALLYTNFILLAFARLRGLIVVVGGVYVLSMLALMVYPFQPQVEIRLGLMAVLGLIVVIVGTVYAQMHRDATLSHITQTKPGELGSDFWLRIASFAAIPVFGLIASQYPELGNTLYSWIEPALHAFK